MSVTLRPYRRGGWEVDITFRLPNGSQHRERKRASHFSKSAAQRWAQDRERHLLQHGPPARRKEAPTLEEFAPRFVDGHARANRHKPSGINAVESILRWHLVPALGLKPLDAISNEQVQRLKLALTNRAPKTVNNVLTVLSTLLKKAVEWGELERLPCAIKLLPNPKKTMGFHDFDQYERLLTIARRRGTEAYLMWCWAVMRASGLAKSSRSSGEMSTCRLVGSPCNDPTGWATSRCRRADAHDSCR